MGSGGWALEIITRHTATSATGAQRYLVAWNVAVVPLLPLQHLVHTVHRAAVDGLTQNHCKPGKPDQLTSGQTHSQAGRDLDTTPGPHAGMGNRTQALEHTLQHGPDTLAHTLPPLAAHKPRTVSARAALTYR